MRLVAGDGLSGPHGEALGPEEPQRQEQLPSCITSRESSQLRLGLV